MAEEEEKAEEWELLPPNTSFLELGLEDIKDLFSKEIDYVDYFIEQPALHLDLSQSPSPQPIASTREIHDEEFQEEIEVEDLKQVSEAEEESTDGESKEVLGEKARPLVVGIGEMLSIGAAVAAAMLCGFLLGNGRRKDEPPQRRADTMRFRIYNDDKALKEMVRRANRINQVLVVTASGMPPPVMQSATISFGGCFGDML